MRRNLWNERSNLCNDNDLFGDFEDFENFDVEKVKCALCRNVLGRVGVVHLHGV